MYLCGYYLCHTGCEYGDRDVTYCSQRLRRDCYDVNIQHTCCASCAAERDTQAPADCQFGDKASWCNPAEFDRSSCYTAASATCCETCATYRTGPPGEITRCAHVTLGLKLHNDVDGDIFRLKFTQ